MSFLKTLFTNLASGGHHNRGYGNYNKHGRNYYQPDQTQMGFPNLACPKCQAPNQQDAKFCAQCGNNLQALNCSSCKQALAPGSKFCSQCGSSQ